VQLHSLPHHLSIPLPQLSAALNISHHLQASAAAAAAGCDVAATVRSCVVVCSPAAA
jgi:hypothetical protein